MCTYSIYDEVEIKFTIVISLLEWPSYEEEKHYTLIDLPVRSDRLSQTLQDGSLFKSVSSSFIPWLLCIVYHHNCLLYGW